MACVIVVKGLTSYTWVDKTSSSLVDDQVHSVTMSIDIIIRVKIPNHLYEFLVSPLPENGVYVALISILHLFYGPIKLGYW